MLRNRSIIILLTIILATLDVAAGLAGRIEISPSKPSTTKDIDLQYSSGELFKGTKQSLYAFVYTFNEREVYPTAFSFPLTKSGDSYRATVTGLPADAVFAMVKIGDGHLFDWNGDQMWDFRLYQDGKAARGAALRCALSYLGSVVPSLRRSTNFDKAKHELRLEIQGYPDNVQAKVGLASVLLETNEIDKAEFSKRIEELVATGYDKTKENEVRAVSRALRAIGRPADGDEAEKAYTSSHPTSDLAEEAARSRCYQSQSREEFETRVTEYVKTFNYTVFSDRMYIDLISSYLQQGNGDQAIRLIRAYPVPPGVNSNPPPAILNMFAVSLLKQDSLIGLARQYAERAIRSAESHASEARPRFMAKEEYDFSNREIEGIAHDTYGFILRQLNKPAEAADEFRKCVDLLGDAATAENFEHLSEALASSSRNTESVEVMRQAIRTARALPQTNQRFLTLASPDQAQNTAELKVLQEQAHGAKLVNLRQTMMNYDIQNLTFTSNDGKKAHLSDFSFTTLEGKKVGFEDLKGKVVVLDFWATWCGPCRMSMPYMQKVYEKYRDNNDVQIVMVNVWERTSDTTEAQRLVSRTKIVKDFLTQNKDYSFPMMMDVTDAIVGCFGVTGIPTKFYLDKNGKVQFKEVGFPGADVFVQEASDKIDVLLQQ